MGVREDTRKVKLVPKRRGPMRGRGSEAGEGPVEGKLAVRDVIG